ncbi:MAG: D-tyrosyl-tRNA(Tyr) deacylase [Bacteroidia bacterium]|nr:D-tyrosyl-tRNA(Tyr) deacylase [Bacteroidia bacterium]
MRALIQRVTQATVTVKGAVKGSCRKGLLVLAGIEEADTQDDVDWLSGKIAGLRIFNDSDDKMNLSVKEINGEILVISQFTLFASTRKGNRPSYIRAARPEIAIPLYNSFVQALEQETGKPVATGEFGAHMEVSLVNDGPVTIMIDSKNRE